MLKTLAVAGLAKKLVDEARKPHNQAKVRSAVAQVRARRHGSRVT